MTPSSIRPEHIITASLVLSAIGGAVYATTYISQESVLVSLAASWGYIGVFITGVISGLNAVFPVPAATLTPIFSAAGLSLLGITLALALGTLVADFVSYLFGYSTKNLVAGKYPKITKTLETITTSHRRWLFPSIVIYAAFIPFPNEAILIPLAFSGIRFTNIIIPLLIGGIIHQCLLVYGIDQLVRFF